MRQLFLLVLAAASAVAYSVIDYTKLPDCARQCVVLSQAESSCVPPAAPVTTQTTYQSCVCQSALLTGLHSSGAQCQATGCSADDAAKITTYYNALCNGPTVEPATTTGTTTATTTGTATGTATAGAAGNQLTSTQRKTDWVSTHKGWLAFAICFVLLFLIGLFGGLWLKRRHDRKHDAMRANVAAHDAPFNPPASSTQRALPGVLRSSTSKANASVSTINGSASTINRPTPTPPPPATAMSGRSGNTLMDGGIGGIAPPRGPNRLRSRSSTLQSLGLSNGSKANLPDPVAWGPHQYQALHNVNHQASSDPSVPPSPSSAITPPSQAYRNREISGSEPRFNSYKASVEDVHNYSPAPTIVNEDGSVGSVDKGSKLCEISPIRPSRTINEIRFVSFAHVDSSLVEAQPQRAEFCRITPNKVLNPRAIVESTFPRPFSHDDARRVADETRAAGETVEEDRSSLNPTSSTDEFLELTEACIQERLRAPGKPSLPMEPLRF